MAVPKITGAQIDFSAGELDDSVKRAHDSIQKIGARNMTNWRVLSSKALQNRSGRSALFPFFSAQVGRVEEFTIGSNFFLIAFSSGKLSVASPTGTLLFNTGTFLLTPAGSPVSVPWNTDNDIGANVWTQIKNSIYITYPSGAPNNVPQVLSWDGVSTWTCTPYNETISNGQKRTPFYRISPPNITMVPSATTGNINITFSAPVLSSGMVGTRMRYANRQIQITSFVNANNGTATVCDPLPPSQTITTSAQSGTFSVGDLVTGSLTGAQGIVTGTPNQESFHQSSGGGPARIGDFLTGSPSTATGTVISAYFDGVTWQYTVQIASGSFANGDTISGSSGGGGPFTIAGVSGVSLIVQILPNASNIIKLFSTSDTIVGPSGSATISTVTGGAPQAISVWDDEVMNFFRGFPTSVFADQTRLGFCNFPSVPQGIAWSAINLPYDLFVGALPDNAIFELAPDNSQVFFVTPGMESSEFVFTDRAIYYIPITPTVPLVPGSVAFNKLSDFGCLAHVQPRRAEQTIVYIKAGGGSVGAVQAPGAYYRPYVVDNISEIHSHLFINQSPRAIAIPSGPTQFAELYIYILLANGTLVTGRYVMRQGLLEPGPEGKPAIGWLPWSGAGAVTWIAARQSDMIFTTSYVPNGVPAVSVVERLDNNQYLDGALLVNSLPAPFTPPGGKGPLYVYPGPNSTVVLIDLGTLFLGTYHVDANGFLIAQGTPGENLSSIQLVAGQSWTAALEPFMPEAPPGQSAHQRMMKRRVSRMAVYRSNGTGYVMARLFAGPLIPGSPALGTIVNSRRFPTWYPNENATLPPPLRDDAQRWRPLGRAFDPRVGILKDTPGPLVIEEFGIEVTI